MALQRVLLSRGYILSMLLYGRRIAQETGSSLMALWSSQVELMYFMDMATRINDLRSMIANMTTNTKDLLCEIRLCLKR